MVSMLVIFFIEFASSRYLAHIDEHIMQLQLHDGENQDALIEPITSFLSRQNVFIGGKKVDISAATAGEAAARAVETIISSPTHPPDEESPLLDHADGDTRPNELRKTDSMRRRDSHCGHHHYDPPPLDTGECPDVARKSQLLAVAIMEGGLCFHSIFVGLTLAVATGGGFISLLIAIMFHRISFRDVADLETFEGMGLGARIATLSFPRRSLRPYFMGLLFAVVTPIGMAIGLSIRTLYSSTSTASLITTGVFDSISSGLLIYASLVELLAHEFLMGEMRFEGNEKSVFAGVCIVAGAAAMSLLGLWV